MKTASASSASVIVKPDPKRIYDLYLVGVLNRCPLVVENPAAALATGPPGPFDPTKRSKTGKFEKSLQACHALESFRFDFVMSCYIDRCVTVADSLYSCYRKPVESSIRTTSSRLYTIWPENA